MNDGRVMSNVHTWQNTQVTWEGRRERERGLWPVGVWEEVKGVEATWQQLKDDQRGNRASVAIHVSVHYATILTDTDNDCRHPLLPPRVSLPKPSLSPPKRRRFIYIIPFEFILFYFLRLDSFEL